MDHPLIRLTGIKKAFSGVVVLDGINVDLMPGSVTALLGENGAGKSTLLKIIAGVYHKDAGQMELDGEPVELTTTNDARAAGVAFVHQELHLVPNRTVTQNIVLGWEPQIFKALGFVNAKASREIAQRALDLVDAHVNPDDMVSELSPAQQQLVEIAKALAWPDIRVLLLDEPTSSLPEEQSANILKLARTLAAQGITVVMTTHRMSEAFSVADQIVVMRDGLLMNAVDPKDPAVTRDLVVEWMVGRPMHAMFPDKRTDLGDVVLDVQDLSGGIIHGISFNVRAGEVVGVGGLVGAGRTEMARLIFEADGKSSGSVTMSGRATSGNHPAAAIRAGMALVPENRKEQGLIQKQSLLFNMGLASLDKNSRASVMDRKSIRTKVKEMIQTMRVKTTGPDQTVANLSGGNQQKVVLGKWLLTEPELLILDEPTRGVDVGARAEIYTHIDLVARSGLGVLLISSDMEELIGMSDRVLVMAGGTIVGELSSDEVTPAAILSLASEGTKLQ